MDGIWCLNSYKDDNSEILTLSDKNTAGDEVQGRLLPIISLWHIDYFELKLFRNSQYKKDTLTLLYPSESRK